MGVGQAPLDPPFSLVEETDGKIERFRLDVLAETEGDRSGFRRVGQHPHGFRKGCENLLRPRNPVEKAAHGSKAVVDAHVSGGRVLQLLQHRALFPIGVDVRGKEEHGQPVDGGRRGARDHVGGAGSDGGGAGQGGQTALGPGEAGRRMHHGLLVAGLVVGQFRAVFFQGLSHARDVAMAEDAEHGRHQPLPDAIPLAVLHLEEFDDGLSGGQPGGSYVCCSRHRFGSFPAGQRQGHPAVGSIL